LGNIWNDANVALHAAGPFRFQAREKGITKENAQTRVLALRQAFEDKGVDVSIFSEFTEKSYF
jgi:hypothetical protein